MVLKPFGKAIEQILSNNIFATPKLASRKFKSFRLKIKELKVTAKVQITNNAPYKTYSISIVLIHSSFM